MINWLRNIIGKDKGGGSAKRIEADPVQESANQAVLAVIGRPRRTSRSAKQRAAAEPTNSADPYPSVPASYSNATAATPAVEGQVAAEWEVGDVILDLYEVKQIHEGGGMGLVYRVHHRGWNMDLAVKSPRANYFQTEAQKENFIRECETWINLGLHPHIVSCHYVRALGGIPRVFAEYVEGGSLQDWIDDRRLYEGGPHEALKRILDISVQTAWGLHYAHEQGLIHQDVKPANVLLAPNGMAKISDFGLAKARMAAGEVVGGGTGRTIVGTFGGMTTEFCSPEQAEIHAQSQAGVPSDQWPKLTRQTDIWSWGVGVLEMLVGKLGWHSGTFAPELLKNLSELRVEGVGIPEPPTELLKLLAECFAVEPAGRPKNFGIVADTLKGIYHARLGGEYGRELPEAAELQADALNNRAVSLLDLGRAVEAEKLFDQALVKDPVHLQATYNRGLHLWRHGRWTDRAVVTACEESGKGRLGDWLGPYLLGSVHLERRDADAALSAFSIANKFKRAPEIQQAVAEANRLQNCSVRCVKTLDRHSTGVTSVALSANGRLALSGSKDLTLRLWDTHSGSCLRILQGHESEVKSVALSADGQLAISGSGFREQCLRVWDTRSGRCLKILHGHESDVTSVALSADGRLALSGSNDKTLRLWDTSNGKCMMIFEGHTHFVYSVALSADGCLALSGGWDKTLRLWDTKTGKCLRAFGLCSQHVYSVSMTPEGRWAIAAFHDAVLRIYDTSSGNYLRSLEGHANIAQSVALSGDGRWALSGGTWENTLCVWEVSSGRCLRTIGEHQHPTVALSADGRRALSGGEDGSVKVWDLQSVAREYQSLIAPFAVCQLTGATEALDTERRFSALLSQARKALSESNFKFAWNSTVESRELAGYQFSAEALDVAHQAGLRGARSGLRGGWGWRTIEGHTGLVQSVALSADGRSAWSAGGHNDETLYLWKSEDGKCLRRFKGHGMEVYSVALSRDGQRALTGSGDKTLRLWDASSGECLNTFEGHTGIVWSVALASDACFALSGSGDKTLRLWEVSSGWCAKTFRGHDNAVTSVALSADNLWALSGSWDHRIRVWELSSGKCVGLLEGHANEVRSVALASDARLAISGSRDKTLRVWNLNSGKCLKILEGHASPVNSVALSADGCWALSGSDDTTVRLWDVNCGRCLKTFAGHAQTVTSVAFSEDGRWALSGSLDKTLRIWELEWDYEFPKQKDWDERVLPHLNNFLTLHCTLDDDTFGRVGKPKWKEGDFQKLLAELQYRGFGWLCPIGVHRHLEKMTTEWKGPPSVPWE